MTVRKALDIRTMQLSLIPVPVGVSFNRAACNSLQFTPPTESPESILNLHEVVHQVEDQHCTKSITKLNFRYVES